MGPTCTSHSLLENGPRDAEAQSPATDAVDILISYVYVCGQHNVTPATTLTVNAARKHTKPKGSLGVIAYNRLYRIDCISQLVLAENTFDIGLVDIELICHEDNMYT